MNSPTSATRWSRATTGWQGWRSSKDRTSTANVRNSSSRNLFGSANAVPVAWRAAAGGSMGNRSEFGVAAVSQRAGSDGSSANAPSNALANLACAAPAAHDIKSSVQQANDAPARGWKDFLWRVYENFNNRRIMAVAAGVTFYVLLALFPAIAAQVSLYGLFADPGTIGKHLSELSTF